MGDKGAEGHSKQEIINETKTAKRKTSRPFTNDLH
jgi:hypothetical protein